MGKESSTQDALLLEKEKRIKELEKMVENLISNNELLKSSKQGDTSYIKEAENRIKLLEELIRTNIDGTESGKDILLRLQTALITLRQKLTEQRKRIKELTQEPFLFSTILLLFEQKGDYKFRKAHYTEFNEDSIVHINPESKFNHQSSAKGIITEINSSTAKVEFEDGYTNSYPIGPESNDLLLIDEKNSILQKYSAVVYLEGRTMEVTVPEKLFPSLSPGDKLKLSQKLQVVGYSKNQDSGELATVLSILDQEHCEIDFQGTKHKVLVGKKVLDPGDTVLIDSSRSIVLENLGKDTSKFAVESLTPVSWDDIGGLKEPKAQLLEAFILPIKQEKEYSHYKKKLSKGVLLTGGPGRGKTLLVRGLISNLSELFGKEFLDEGFMYIKGPEILTKFVGEPESFVRDIFARGRAYKKKTGHQAVAFIDEAEAIGRKRGSGKSSDVEMTIVPALLTEMDGLNESAVVVILATNRVDILDPALTRDGRIDIKINVPKPPKEDALEIFHIHMRNAPTSQGLTLDELANFANEEVFSGKYSFFEFTSKSKKKETSLFGLPEILNGAMIAGIVENAKAYALRRDIENKTLTGLSKEDFLKAVSSTFEQNKILNHEDNIEEFISLHDLDIFSQKKLTS
jgi:proteasome-associated ATPase